MNKTGLCLLSIFTMVVSSTAYAKSAGSSDSGNGGYIYQQNVPASPSSTQDTTAAAPAAEPTPAPAAEPTPAPAAEPTPAPAAEPAPAVVPRMAEPATVNGSYSFGDFRSSTLTMKAWQALSGKDTDAVLAYTNKCITMYSAQAAKMQKSLTDYATGDDQKIFSYWALNDVATSLYIQGEALRRAKRMDEAKAAFNRIVNEFSFAQTYDVGNKSFWKPVDAAQDSLYMIDNNLDLDYGNMASNFLVQQMWKSLNDKNLKAVIAYDMKLEHLYRTEALNMQKSLKAYAEMPAEHVHSYWALNDVGTGAFILGEAYRTNNMNDDAVKAYTKVTTDYLYAQCWDPQGWFWKPAEVSQQKIAEIQAAK